ncbi:MAG: HAMP domain-containing histidine kinase [Sphingomonadales bacterium]|nr:HAMP domain-containing histidine kinase [Sphingomonadales bacterium]
MKPPFGSLLGSVHAYFLFLLLVVLSVQAVVSGSLLITRQRRESGEVSVLELARLADGLPLARPAKMESRLEPDPANGTSEAEAKVRAMMAKELLVAPEAVRVALSERDRGADSEVRRELALYGARANPVIHVPFTVAVRRPSGWQTLRPAGRERFGWLGLAAIEMPILALFIAVSIWFSRRVVRPLRQFARAAERLKANSDAAPVPVAGPTELRAAAIAVNGMQQRLAGFVRERTMMFGAIAHDLRAPLARLRFRIEGAQEPLRVALEREIVEMEHLVGVTLEFVQGCEPELTFKPIELAMLVEGVVDDFADAGKAVTMVDTEPVILEGDALLLRRMVSNIIDNAVKYGQTADVSVTRRGEQIEIAVVDRGPGLSDADRARAFDPFFRSEQSRSRATGGTGLGLSIARNAAIAHGGAVVLENQSHRGLRVRVILPA